jgi:FKBP-type peptidyl-prolyl cis-trans isomerase (trigger factor)
MLRRAIKKSYFFQSSKKELLVEVPTNLVNDAMNFFLVEKQKNLFLEGFEKGKVPLAYIKNYFKKSFYAHIEKIFYAFYAKDAFYKLFRNDGIYIKKIIDFDFYFSCDKKTATFSYHVPGELVEYNALPDFKKLRFSERKKYRDLDRQAKHILEEEEANKVMYENSPISVGDWVLLEVFIASDSGEVILKDLSVKLWINVTSEKIDSEIKDLLSGKNVGDQFTTKASFLNTFLSTIFLKHSFFVTIKEKVSSLFFSFDIFKKAFKYESKEGLEKIIELFSLRKDVSLRKEKVQMIFAYFLNKIKIHFDPDSVAQYECILQSQVVKSPDYLLFQSEKNFSFNLKKLACSQAMEKILIDHFIHIFSISSTKALLYTYLNLLQRNRLKEFLYFDFFHTYDNSHCSFPLHNCELEHIACREKAIDFLIKKMS